MRSVTEAVASVASRPHCEPQSRMFREASALGVASGSIAIESQKRR